ncbi:kinase-like domain-containing protein, partial [Jimgerdemannia flammicorona]
MDAGAVKKDSKLKKLVRSGIPASVRGRAWQFLAGSAGYRKTGVYEVGVELIRRDRLPIFDVIERDIHRCYPEHVMFRDENSQGQADLNNVLKAYAHYNPSVGYCQGMGRLVGCMLMQMPAEVGSGTNRRLLFVDRECTDSFWLLVATIDKYMAGYFIPTLSQLRIDAYVFEQLLREHEPKLAQHMVDNDVVPLMYITQWFLTAFTLTLPWPTVLRVWDVFYFEGIERIVFYRIGLAIIWLNRAFAIHLNCHFLSTDHLLRHCPTNAELLEFLLHIPFDNLGPENLLETAFKIKLSKDDIKKYSRKASSEASTQGLPVEFGINNLSAGQLSNNSASALVGAMAGVGGKIKRTAVGGGSAHSGSLGKAGGKKISFIAGTYGSVHKMRHIKTGEVRVAKVQPVSMASVHELEIMRTLRHENVISLEGFFEVDGALVFVMEFAAHGDLSSIQLTSEPALARVVYDILRALAYLHDDAGIIHRDLKPENLLRAEGNVVKIADFGTAVRSGEVSGNARLEDFVDTLPVPPEAFRGLPPTFATDIWALGITLIELLTAEYPHGELEDDEIARLVGWTGEHPPVPQDASPLLHAFLKRCLTFSPSLRATARELLRHPWIVEHVMKETGIGVVLVVDRHLQEGGICIVDGARALNV